MKKAQLIRCYQSGSGLWILVRLRFLLREVGAYVVSGSPRRFWVLDILRAGREAFSAQPRRFSEPQEMSQLSVRRCGATAQSDRETMVLRDCLYDSAP